MVGYSNRGTQRRRFDGADITAMSEHGSTLSLIYTRPHACAHHTHRAFIGADLAQLRRSGITTHGREGFTGRRRRQRRGRHTAGGPRRGATGGVADASPAGPPPGWRRATPAGRSALARSVGRRKTRDDRRRRRVCRSGRDQHLVSASRPMAV